jgi:predicted PurR-regulated permease PerM
VGIFLSEQFEKMDIDNSIITEIEKIWTRFLDTIASIMLGVANSTGTFITGFVSGVFNAILSTVLAIYMLLSKESLMHTFKKVLLAFTPERFSKAVVKYAKIVDDSFENFIRGQMLEAIVLGVICYIGMVLFNFEYALLISVLVGLTNVIPLFGPYIGAVPSFLLLLMVNPVQAFWFLLYVSILQQIESNLIYPRVVGSSMGISGFWIIVAVVVGNSLFGIIGILLGIPLLSSLYVIIGEITEKRLKRKNIRI